MRRFFCYTHVFLIWILCPSSASLAMTFEQGENVDIRGELTDSLFAAGDQIFVSPLFRSTDDVYIAGGTIRFTGETKENLFSAGGEITLQDASMRSGIFAGGKTTVNTSKSGDLLFLGGKLTLKQATISDDLVAAGGELFVDRDTSVGGSALLAGGSVAIFGRIAGDLQVRAGQIKIGPSAVVDGDFTYSADAVDIDPGAKILGKTTIIPRQPTGWSAPFWGSIASILFLLGALTISPILAVLFPKTMEQGRNQFRSRHWESLGIGTVIALVVPGVFFLLLISVIGFPVAFASVPFLLVAGLLSWSIAVYTCGHWLRMNASKQTSDPSGGQRFIWTFFGAVIVSLLVLIPLLGQILALLLLLTGLGALFNQARIQLTRKPLTR